jgi:RNA polymerase sigma-70 factor (ECF subfamily)
MSHPSESEEVARAIADFRSGRRREESFRYLFETYHRRVEGFFARRAGSPRESCDLTQETFLRVYTGLEGFRGEAPFGAWLYRIAWNVYVQLVVRRRRGEPVYGIDPEDGFASATGPEAPGGLSRLAVEPDGLTAVLEDEQRELLRRAIGELPDQRRKCIVLWAYHGLTYEQIAVVMQLALGTVKAHLAQARQQLVRLVDTRAATPRERRP